MYPIPAKPKVGGEGAKSLFKMIKLKHRRQSTEIIRPLAVGEICSSAPLARPFPGISVNALLKR